MNELKIFQSSEFGEIRTFKEADGSVTFCGSDVAKSLGYSNPSKAIIDHCKGITKRETLTAGGLQLLNFITKGDICRLAAGSQLPGALRSHKITDNIILGGQAKRGHLAVIVFGVNQCGFSAPRSQRKLNFRAQFTEINRPKNLYIREDVNGHETLT